MSTILDALKKSEQERKLNNVPTLADMPAPEEASRWPVYLGVGMATLFLVSLAVLLTGRPVEPAAQAGAAIVLNNQTLAESSSQSADTQPTVVVNVVSYSPQPEQRFVMINGNMYREGEFVRPGLKVLEINEGSVIFNERGRRIEKQP